MTASVSAEQALVLGIAGTRERRQRTAGRLLELAAQADPHRLLAVLARQRLTQLGIARLRELGAEELLAAIESSFEAGARGSRAVAVVNEALTEELVGALEQQGVPAVPLKGPGLARALYDDPALRESLDVDLLVSGDHLDEAVAVLRSTFGFAAPRDVRAAAGRPLLHYRLVPPGGSPAVEVHWRVHWYEERSGAAMVMRSLPERGGRRLRPVDELASLLLFYGRDGFIGVRPLADIAAWWDRCGDQLPDDGLAAFIDEFAELGPVISVGMSLAHDLAGLPAERLGTPLDEMSWRMRRARRFANWPLEGKNQQVLAEIAFVDFLMTPPAGALSFLRRQILLPLDLIAARQPDPRPGRARLGLAAARHVARIAYRFVIALIATRGGRSRCAAPAEAP